MAAHDALHFILQKTLSYERACEELLKTEPSNVNFAYPSRLHLRFALNLAGRSEGEGGRETPSCRARAELLRIFQPTNSAEDPKKNGMTNRKIVYWVIPPEADGRFIAHMEEVLEAYAKPYDPTLPVLYMDEQPVQLLKETRVPIPATRQHVKRHQL